MNKAKSGFKNLHLHILFILFIGGIGVQTTFTSCSSDDSDEGGGVSSSSGGATSLDGVWERDDNTVVVSVSGNSGILSSYNPTTVVNIDAKNKGYVAVGSQYWRNLTSTGALTWSGQLLAITSNTSSPNVATGTSWINVTITMSTNGQTLTSTYSLTSGETTRTWTRSSSSSGGGS